MMSTVLGKWRIFESDEFDPADLNLVEPAYIQFNADGLGEFMFICVTGSTDCSFSQNGASFMWEGNDEMDPASGQGDADLGEDGVLTITISMFRGDEYTLRARRWEDAVPPRSAVHI